MLKSLKGPLSAKDPLDCVRAMLKAERSLTSSANGPLNKGCSAPPSKLPSTALFTEIVGITDVIIIISFSIHFLE